MLLYKAVLVWTLSGLIFVNGVIEGAQEKSLDDFCSKNSSSECICTVIQPKYIFTCSNDDGSEGQVTIVMKNEIDFLSFECENMQSSKTFPDLSEYINESKISLKGCTVPINTSLYDYTSKISKNILHIELIVEKDEDKNFNSNYFEGLSDLKSLILHFEPNIDFNFALENVFMKLDKLKLLKLYNFPTPNGIFDSLKQLRVLTIHSYDLKISSLESGLLKNQRNLTLLRISGRFINFNIFPNIFANLTELQTLELTYNSFNFLPENMLKNNHKMFEFKFLHNDHSIVSLPRKLFANKLNLEHIELAKNGHEYLPEDLFENSPNIFLIEITKNYLSSLPKDIFKDKKYLRLLDLSSNLLKNLTEGLFDSLSSLVLLFLSHNKLSSLSK